MAALNGLSGILNIASSGLSTAQLGLNVTSNNIANVDTPGYNAAKMSTTSLGDGGVGVAQITATVNRYLQQASLVATSSASQYSASASNFSSAQNLFGDPSSSSNLFSQLNSVFSSFSTLAASNTSTAQSAAVSSISSFLNNASSISQGLDSLQNATDSQIKSDVTTVNSLLQNISDLNTQISEGSVGVNDTTSLQNQQAEDVTQLSQYMNITVTPGTGLTGTGVTIRAGDGTPLTTPGFAPAVFAYTQANGQNQLTFTPPGGTSQPYGTRLSSGELQGLLVSRNTDIPGIAAQLSQLTSSAAQALNTASNAHTSVPAPTTLTGQPLGMDVASAVGTFTGKTSLNIDNSAGEVQNSQSIDFTAGTITPAGGSATSFTPSTFVSTMNTVLGGLTGATATVSTNTAGNALNFAATGTNGLVFSDDATTPASSGGQNFSQYFGLNNVVSSSILSNYNTGLSAASTSGYTSGAITFSLTAPNGGVAKTISFTPPATGTVGGLVSALNNGVTPITTNASGQAVMVRSITTHSLNGTLPDYSCLDTSEAVVPDFVLVSLLLYWLNVFKPSNPRVAPDLPADSVPYPAGVAYPALWSSSATSILNDFANGIVAGLQVPPIIYNVANNPVVSAFDPIAGRIMSAVTVQPMPGDHQIGVSILQSP